jgi:NADPH:quinone reductase-like Zn-dependent oxidoreductase
VLATAQALQRSAAAAKPRLWVVTDGACAVESAEERAEVRLEQSPLTGLARGLALEAPELRCTLLDTTEPQAETAGAAIGAEILRDVEEPQVAFRSERRLVARLEAAALPAVGVDTEHGARTLALGMGIDALEYRAAERREPAPDEVEISVRATALNFRDVLKATGLLDHDGPIGTDCSGTIARVGSAVTGWRVGDRVVAIAPGCFGSHVNTAAALVVRKPDALSFEDAAAQNVAYLTADYCLHELARIRPGERVLISAAAGGVGLAAVHLCLRAGAEVYAMAGREEKRAWLRHLGLEHVYDSRSLGFREQIAGGVDVVLNSLAGPAVDAGLSLLRPGGRFVELGKTDLRPAAEMVRLYPETAYFVADLTPLFTARSPWAAEHMAALLEDVTAGRLPALPLAVFEEAETKQAFRHMAGARHIGRIVIRRGSRDFGGKHLVTGGLRGVGLKLAEWLAAEGAQELVLMGRRAPESDTEAVLAGIRARGTDVLVVTGDVADREAAQRLAEACGGGLRGVWHCAGATRDAILAEQDWTGMAEVLRPKAEGAWNLDRIARAAKPQYFVLFSSWASLGGSRGQVNYCAANAFLDGLAAARQAEGLPALSVQWGAFGETGMAANEDIQRYLARAGMESMVPREAFGAMARALGARSALGKVSGTDSGRRAGVLFLAAGAPPDRGSGCSSTSGRAAG